MTTVPAPTSWVRSIGSFTARKSVSIKTPIGRCVFEDRPHVFNAATDGVVREIAQDERHPLNLPSAIRLMHWESNRLHLKIKTTMKQFPKATMRSHAIRRVKQCILEQLTRRGYDERGTILHPDDLHSRPSSRKKNLSGALSLTIERETLTATHDTIQASCKQIVDFVINKPANPSFRDKSRAGDPRYTSPFESASYARAKQYVQQLEKQVQRDLPRPGTTTA